jgi:hypothetical protein
MIAPTALDGVFFANRLKNAQRFASGQWQAASLTEQVLASTKKHTFGEH